MASLAITLKVTLTALAASIVISLLMAIIFYFSQFIEKAMMPVTVILQVTPIIAIAPLISIWVDNSEMATLICAFLVAFFPLLNPLGIFTDLRTTSFDTFQTLFPRPALEDDPVVIIDIDDESLNKIGQWPWSRDTLATLTDQTQLAAVTGFDIVFAEPDRTGSKQLQEIYAEDNDLVKQLENIVDHDELFAEAEMVQPVQCFGFDDGIYVGLRLLEILSKTNY